MHPVFLDLEAKLMIIVYNTDAQNPDDYPVIVISLEI